MKLDLAMWRRALNVIPQISVKEWRALDIVSRWLISSRAAVLIMTFLSGALAGIFALRDGGFQFVPWLALTFGLVMAHAANNIFNDHMDFVRGVDRENYYRTIYGAQPLVSGLVSRREHLLYFATTGICALVPALYLLIINAWDPLILLLVGAGAFFVLFYTWPLKYVALGEIAVLLVWGPLMIGGGYYVLAHRWDWNVVVASLPYVFGVTTVIFGKHIDKLTIDRAKHIYTLPVLIGERLARYIVLALMILAYVATFYLMAIRFFTPALALVLFSLPTTRRTVVPFLSPKPANRPLDFPDGQGGWPLYFAPLAFVNNRAFGIRFLAGVILDAGWRLWPVTASIWQ